MRQAPGSLQPPAAEPPAPELRLLVPHDPWFRSFLRNLGDIFHRPSPLQLESAPADFWPDVFVSRRLPWSRFVQSSVFHALALMAIWGASQVLALQPRVVIQSPVTHPDVVYYEPSPYLPPLDTRRASPAPARNADPEYSAQPIISLPPEPDNRSQTIVAPPNVKLDHDVALLNMVALLEKTAETAPMPIAPAPTVTAQMSRPTPRLEHSIIAPPPDLQAKSKKTFQAPEPSVIAPPPAVEATPTRRLGDLNIGHSSVIAPAPQLALEAQRAVPRGSSAALRSARSSDVIAPPPSLSASGRSRSAGTTIALSLHPAVGAPPDSPAGNRRGAFASTPEGHRGATGAASGNGNSSGSGSGKNSGNVPAGIYVGKTPNATSSVAGDPARKSLSPAINPNLIANARPPTRALQAESAGKLSALERQVFGDRKFYSLSLNMPNLNSAGGSWIIRFAAIKSDASAREISSRAAASEDSSAKESDLSSPSATRKVDPAYPLELMKQNVGGTVILYGVIRADGTVGSVRVLRSVDDRLDEFARAAIAKWLFQPATKNGSPVDVEATFSIPFKPAKF
jgi:TonB family protein